MKSKQEATLEGNEGVATVKTPRLTRSKMNNAGLPKDALSIQSMNSSSSPARRATPGAATNDSSSLFSTETALRAFLTTSKRSSFPYRVLAMLQWADQSNSPWITWTPCGSAFYLPSPDDMKQSDEFCTMIEAFFAKRFDLVLRSLSEWGWDCTVGGASDPVLCEHPLVNRQVIMLDLETKQEIAFQHYNRKRPRPSLPAAGRKDKNIAPSSSMRNVKAKANKTAPNNRAKQQRSKPAPISTKTQGEASKLPPPPASTTSVTSRRPSRRTVAAALSADPGPQQLSSVPIMSVFDYSAKPADDAVSRRRTPQRAAAPKPKNDAFMAGTDKKRTAFPMMLYRLLNELHENGLGSVIGWSNDGTSVRVRRGNTTVDEAAKLQPYFAHGAIHNIVRQMYRYEFTQVPFRENWVEFSHPCFKRDNVSEDSLSRMKPKSKESNEIVTESYNQNDNMPEIEGFIDLDFESNEARDWGSETPAPPIVTRGDSCSLMDLIETVDLEEAAAAVGAAEVLAGRGSPASIENRPSFGQSYYTPRKGTIMSTIPSTGLTPLANLVYPTVATPDFNSMPSTPLDRF